ncbi:MAG: hypothetical protein ACTSQX_04345 [Candidatus Heimdallarchaeota archaeon]
MSGYIHKIAFKVLIDSEVVDFTFNVPRGTLLIQVLDELETTLKIHPRVIATVNNSGEIVLIENHYSPIDYLIQLHGAEFYAGGSSVVTFNHDVYVVDLEVPEAIPFSSAFRTACKSFSVSPFEVSIERQDGQIMDHEVFSLATAFVLNSWGNFYRLLDKELGDVLTEPPKSPEFTSQETDDIKEEMVYPPKLDGSDLIEIANKLMEATPTEESEIDSMTDHFVESSFSDKKEEPIKEDELLTTPVKIETRSYPWKREPITEEIEEVEEEDEEPIEQTIESLLEDVLVVDSEEISSDESATFKAPTEALESSFDNLYPSEEQEEEEVTTEDDLVVFAQDYDEAEEEKEEEDLFDYLEEESDLTDVEDPLETEEESSEPILTLDDEEEVQIIEAQEETAVQEESISDLPEIEEEQITEDLEEELIPVSEEVTETDELTVVSSTDAIVDEIDEVVEETVSEEQLFKPLVDTDLPLNERLEQRKTELATIEAALKAEESKQEIVQQRSVSVEYYEKMRPQKIFPLIVRIPPFNGNTPNDKKETDLTVTPIFPGCIVTPREELVNLKDKNLQQVDFSITPIIARGKIPGKVSLYYKKRNILNANINSRIFNHLGAKITGVLSVIMGIFLLLPLFNVDVNSSLSTGFNTTFGTSLPSSTFLYIEIALAAVFVILTIILLVTNKPKKRDLTRKFYPVAPNQDD